MLSQLSTGQVAQFLNTSEPRLNELIRRRKVDPAPPVVVGRRQWHHDHIAQAAEALGVLTPDLNAQLAADAVLAPQA